MNAPVATHVRYTSLHKKSEDILSIGKAYDNAQNYTNSEQRQSELANQIIAYFEATSIQNCWSTMFQILT